LATCYVATLQSVPTDKRLTRTRNLLEQANGCINGKSTTVNKESIVDMTSWQCTQHCVSGG